MSAMPSMPFLRHRSRSISPLSLRPAAVAGFVGLLAAAALAGPAVLAAPAAGVAAAPASAALAAPVPRPAPALTYTTPAGRVEPLADGKVTVAVFLLTRCPHCWRVAQMVTKLDRSLAEQGLKTVAIAFDKDVNGPVVADFAARSGVPYTVGYTGAEQVDRFLGREGAARFQVPQVVVLDRAGMIRAQSHPTGETSLEDETYLRGLVAGLLKEAPPAAGK